MIVKKARCILINKQTKKIGLVYRKLFDDYSFPKGHLEKNETIAECAIRETIEETGRDCKLVFKKSIKTIKYNSSSEDVIVYMFVALDIKETSRFIKDEDKEVLIWKDFDDVIDTLTYQDLKDFWISVKNQIFEIINN